jgi:hypothetical protein
MNNDGNNTDKAQQGVAFSDVSVPGRGGTIFVTNYSTNPNIEFYTGANIIYYQHNQTPTLPPTPEKLFLELESSLKNNNRLPSVRKMKQLIIYTGEFTKYSYDEDEDNLIRYKEYILLYNYAVHSIKLISECVSKENNDKFLEYFHRHGGLVRILNFLNKQYDYESDAHRIDHMEMASSLISELMYLEVDKLNKKHVNVKNISESLEHCDGIDILINASIQYAGDLNGDMPPQPRILQNVWNALFKVPTNLINEDRKNVLLRTGQDIYDRFNFENGDDALSTLQHVFYTLLNTAKGY